MSLTAPSRAPVARSARRRDRMAIVKAIIGIAVLVFIALVAAVAAVHTMSSIVNRDSSALQRYADGHDRVKVTSRAGRFRAEFPTQPTASTETEHLFFPIKAQRLVSPVGHDTVELVWFDVPPAVPVHDPAAFLAALAPSLATDLGGTATGGKRIGDATLPAYQFLVPAKPGARGHDYHVTTLLDGHRVYVLRVQAARDADAAMNTLTDSFRLLDR